MCCVLRVIAMILIVLIVVHIMQGGDGAIGQSLTKAIEELYFNLTEGIKLDRNV